MEGGKDVRRRAFSEQTQEQGIAVYPAFTTIGILITTSAEIPYCSYFIVCCKMEMVSGG